MADEAKPFISNPYVGPRDSGFHGFLVVAVDAKGRRSIARNKLMTRDSAEELIARLSTPKYGHGWVRYVTVEVSEGPASTRVPDAPDWIE